MKREDVYEELRFWVILSCVFVLMCSYRMGDEPEYPPCDPATSSTTTPAPQVLCENPALK